MHGAAALAARWRKRPTKEPEEAAPGRSYSVEWVGHNLPEEWPEGEPFYAYVSAINTGSRTWQATPPNEVNLVVKVNRQVHSFARLPYDIAPGAWVLIGFPLTLPSGLGDWELMVNLVEQDVAWFERQGVLSLRALVRRAPSPESRYDGLRLIARRANWSFYTPSQNVSRGRDGRPYPVLINSAAGCTIRDADGHEWIDWVMGYGSALLGYGHPEVAAAVTSVLGGGAVMSLPHELEMEVTRQLLELIPCAEVVLFGKNGSDCCTAAVRTSRLATSRSVVLFSGFHGWQEPFAQTFEPALRAVPQSAYRFELNDLDGFCRLVAEHKGTIAAVMLEPGGQVEGVDGPVRDVDRSFLRHVAEICRNEGAILIFDEIMTGFRTAQGSVQKATGVTPDLAVFGKGLGAGFPLSVLVGSTAVLGSALDRLFYHPTFKSDAVSMAAASAALQIYRTTDVAQHVGRVGRALRSEVNEISRELGIDGELTGLPYRLVYRFNDRDETLRALKRTLLQQELLKAGVLTFRGFMLASLSHTEKQVTETSAAFRSALAKVQQATEKDAFTSELEIPLVV